MHIIAQHQRGTTQPRKRSRSREVGAHREIAETLFPIGQFETVLRVHLQVYGEQVIAGVRAVPGHLFEEKFPRETFADQPPEHVREGDNDGVDGAGADLGFEMGEGHGSNANE